MRAEELAVLNGINIAGTISPHGGRDKWWCTAEEIAEVLGEEDGHRSFREEFGEVIDRVDTARKVGVWLRKMNGGDAWRFRPLVERDKSHHRTLWRMSELGLRALSA